MRAETRLRLFRARLSLAEGRGLWATLLLGGLLVPGFWAGASSAAGEPSAVAAPLLTAAGDIACDPTDPYFNDGRGRRGLCRQLATSRLLRGADTVLPLGDNQYDHGSLRNYRRSYDRSWGRYLPVTRPVIGNHEYGTLKRPNLGADVVLSGHDHSYERFAKQSADGSFTPKGLRQFTVSTGGRSLGSLDAIERNSRKRLRAYGVLRLRLRDGGYGWSFARTDGRFFDRGRAACV